MLGRIWRVVARVVAGPHWVRDDPVRPEDAGFYASTEPAGGTAPPDEPVDWRGIAEGLREALEYQNARVRELETEVRRWKTCATEMSHRYEGREPRPEEWPDGSG